jgi:Ser/Thr protein kinase RdoA (MazF antagonist)
MKEILEQNYNIGEIQSIKKAILGGYLNNSWIVTTNKSKYFLQETNQIKRKFISQEIKVLEYLQTKNFPNLKFIKNTQGKKITFLDKSFILLSEFIEGFSPNKFNNLSINQITNAAITLAKYHKVMEDYPIPEHKVSNTPNRVEALSICNGVKEKIKNKTILDNFDKEILEIIDKKIDLLQNFKIDKLERLKECPKIFCHGDYHGANLIFNKNEKVIGIVDWELSGKGYRIWEVLRSMSFLCDIDYNGSMIGPIDFKKALKYLQAYHNSYPLTELEISLALELIQFKSLCSCFIIDMHYNYNRKDTDIFKPNKPSHWFWWIENGQLFKKEVLDKLEFF